MSSRIEIIRGIMRIIVGRLRPLDDSWRINVSDRRTTRTRRRFVDTVAFPHFLFDTVKNGRFFLLDVIAGDVAPLMVRVLDLPPVFRVVEQQQLVILPQAQFLRSLSDIVVLGDNIAIFNGFAYYFFKKKGEINALWQLGGIWLNLIGLGAEAYTYPFSDWT